VNVTSRLHLLVVCALASLLFSTVALANSTTVVVTGADVGNTWFKNDTRTGGAVNFVIGPATPPLGVGSLEMATTDAVPGGSSQAKAQLFTYKYIGTKLSDIDTIRYAAYRGGSSTNSLAQTISLNLEVDYAGDGSTFTTLVFEPVYNPAQGPMLLDSWQEWDAFAGGSAVWWSTRAIPGVCAFNCFVPWSTIIANNPNAKIKFGFGFNVGSGWVGVYSGAADKLTFGVSGDSTVYDFEPYRVARTKDDCKNGGWQQVRRADGSPFKNQGDCIQYVNTGK
jgi:hypothetical protein